MKKFLCLLLTLLMVSSVAFADDSSFMDFEADWILAYAES